MNSRKSFDELNKIEGIYIKKIKNKKIRVTQEPFESSIGVIHMVLRKTKHIWFKYLFFNLGEEKKESSFFIVQQTIYKNHWIHFFNS